MRIESEEQLYKDKSKANKCWCLVKFFFKMERPRRDEAMDENFFCVVILYVSARVTIGIIHILIIAMRVSLTRRLGNIAQIRGFG